MADKTCANCGATIPAGATRCPNCGTQLTVTLGAHQTQAFLQIAPDNGKAFTVALLESTVHIGSDPAQEVSLQARGIAPRMARLSSEGASFRLFDLSNYPGDVKVNDQIIDDALLKNGDRIRLQDGTGIGVTLTFINPQEMAAAPVERKTYTLTDQPFTIGRNPNSALYLDALAVSWNHAQIVKRGNDFVLTDFGSSNGTYVNDEKITRPVELHDDDVIRVEQVLLTFKDGTLWQSSTIQNFDMDGMNLQMQVQSGRIRRRAVNLLNDVSLSLDPNEFVAIIGGSGSGKSTLLRALNGANQATGGQVLVNGDNLYANYELYQPVIGYVPQTDIVQSNLTVRETLTFGARMRFPNEPEVSRVQRVDRVIEQLQLKEAQATLVGRLSGGQKKRVSIAMELMAEPHLLFMDEPSSGLDPGLDRSMMETLRRLASRGNIVVVVTHTTLNIGMCDKLAIMSRGYLTFYGPPKEALAFFGVRDYTELYNRVLHAPDTRASRDIDPKEAARLWSEAFKKTAYYEQFVIKRQAPTPAEMSAKNSVLSNQRLQRRRRGSFGQQAQTLVARTLALALRDFRTLIALLVVLPLVGLFLGLISWDKVDNTRGQMLIDRFENEAALRSFFDRLPLSEVSAPPEDTLAEATPEAAPTQQSRADRRRNENAAAQGGTAAPSVRSTATYIPANEAQRLLFMLALSVALLGIFAAAYTIVEEKTLFLREHMANLRIAPYLTSKVVVYGIFSLFSCFLAMIALSVGVVLPEQGVLLWGPLEIFITLALTSLAGVSIGLLISALNRQVNAVTYLVLFVLFVQILLPGVLFPMEGPLEVPSRLTITRWSLEALGATAHMVERDAESHFVVEVMPVNPRTNLPLVGAPAARQAYRAPTALSVDYPTTANGLLVHWGVLAAFSIVFLLGAGRALDRNESF
ncbi:MAG: ATP-binding cassette domain-containing protein [Chloroflexi bacterium]|uniref:ATP-binding cassette domain-containing protein n=1 Tax=Candidatus Flexifilum breve TaxID=3140694 RepID=UPI003135C2C9|nr:ATP-binding cassette domain-containing protein [Chloroflexota bacterium]